MPNEWHVLNGGSLYCGKTYFGYIHDQEIAERIVACLNACASIPTERLQELIRHLPTGE